MKKLIILCMVILLGGCAEVQTQVTKEIVTWTEQDIKNIEALRPIAENILKVWPFYNRLIRLSFGDQLQREFPMKVISAMTYLDKMSAIVDNTELSYDAIAHIIYAKSIISSKAVQEIILRIAPELYRDVFRILDLLPGIL